MAKSYQKSIRKALAAYENGKVSESRKIIGKILRSKAVSKIQSKKKEIARKYFG